MPKRAVLSYSLDTTSRKLLWLLFAADIFFILLHLVHKFSPYLPDSLYSLTRDGGYAEFYQYAKELWIILLLIGLARSQRKLLYVSFAGLFSFFLLDDYLQIHENAGWNLANYLQIKSIFGLRPQDFGELAVFGFFGLLFALLIGLSHYRSEAGTRRISWNIIGLVFLLAIFGIFFDMLEISVNHPLLGPIIAIIDDGGELLVMSAITAFLFGLPQQHSPQNQAARSS